MSSSDHDQDSAEERFERLLIDSAHSDPLPSNVDASWHQFGVALSGASLLATGAGGAFAVQRAQRWLAAKWLICGILAGSALTALSLRASHGRHIAPSAALSAPIAAPTSTNRAATPGAAIEVEAPDTASLATPKAPPHSPRPRPSTWHGQAAPPPLPTSTLNAQVALLDAARSAIASAAFPEALRLADRYRADFPNGELAPEAEVVAIEALVQSGEQQPAALRAARFFARYPGDPHRARVKWLVR